MDAVMNNPAAEWIAPPVDRPAHKSAGGNENAGLVMRETPLILKMIEGCEFCNYV
jgi:hypothetical protein